ncbi:MAG: ABC transporter ATP-binding protein [SAR324 cluster bacterium]|nr:ABC transporter ATP-binding protein [SAR324 cluster bacterium]MBL7035123.1 ABC transporter ATP-binding protein [SAR324 cluster bacterium]
MSVPLLQINNLSIEFNTRRGNLVAVEDISFEVAEGEIFGIVGESGAGKSLTGKAIIGLLEAPGRISGGKILLNNERIDNLPYEQMRRLRGKSIGMVFQDPLTSLNPLYTIGRQLIETIQTHTNHTATQAKNRALELLREVGIPAAEKRIDQFPHQFSGGMRQRVVIALALCVNPKLIIADEPTTALDVSIQAQILTLLKNLCRKHGTAVILITHDMGVIAETANRVAVMYAGKIAEIGPVREVVQNPQHPYAQGLMASIPVIGRKMKYLAQIDGSMPRIAERPSGCAFHPRCPHAIELCNKQIPELLNKGKTKAACLLFRNGNP